MPIHLGFDMGIRNLAYCLIEHLPDSSWKILAWDNIDLLEQGQSSQTSGKCAGCSKKASFSSNDGARWCKICAQGSRKKATLRPSVGILPCKMDAKTLRAHAVSLDIEGAKKMKKEDLLQTLGKRYLMPWHPPKAADATLTDIRQSMDKWLDEKLPLLQQATRIRLENQPVLKGPTMKSVQMILFTLLGHRLEREHSWKGALEFVHAGYKSKSNVEPNTSGLTETQAEGLAYRSRKKTAETDVLEHLTKVGSSWLPFYQSRTKKSDLADAFLMALR